MLLEIGHEEETPGSKMDRHGLEDASAHKEVGTVCPSRLASCAVSLAVWKKRASQGDPGDWEGDWQILGEMKGEGEASRTPRVPGQRQRLDIALESDGPGFSPSFATC